MEHTFLFLEGVWVAKGSYFDDNKVIPFEGRTEVTHLENLWLNEGYIRLLAGNAEFKNKYEIVPFEKERDFTTWRSFNPALGTLAGKFMLVDDTIMSVYTSENGDYSGVECLTQVSETSYKGRGFAFIGDGKLSSWAVELCKKE